MGPIQLSSLSYPHACPPPWGHRWCGSPKRLLLPQLGSQRKGGVFLGFILIYFANSKLLNKLKGQ